MNRCFDCFAEIQGEACAVLRKLRDMPPDADPVEARLLDGLLYEPVLVCADCSGWYGDHAMLLTSEETRQFGEPG